MSQEPKQSIYTPTDRPAGEYEYQDASVERTPTNPTTPDPTLSSRVIEEQTTYADGEVHRTAVERSQVVVRSEEDLIWLRWRVARRTAYFIVHVIAIFILIRFVLMLFGANPENAFAAFIYGLTWIVMAPFNTLFGPGAEPVYGATVFNASALFAIAMYYLFTWIGIRIAYFVLRRQTLSRVDRQTAPPL
jgi:YggT family protein